MGCTDTGENITVKENNIVPTNKVAIQKLDVYKNSNPVGWLNNHLILETNKEGVYQRDVRTKKTKLFIKDPNLYPIVLSPDKKHLFFCIIKGEIYSYYMLDIATKKRVPIRLNSDDIDANDPNWVDNQNLIFTNPNSGEIYMVNINGKVTKINYTLPHYDDVVELYQLVKVKDQLFFISEERLFVWNQKTNQTKQLMDRAAEFVLSPNKKSLAVVKMIPNDPNDPTRGLDNFSGKTSLVLMDLTGKEISTVAEGEIIGAVSWSLDSCKLAYHITKSEQPSELYIKNLRDPHPTLLTANIQVSSVNWNPSGKRLLIHGYSDFRAADYGKSMYVISLKKDST